MYFSIYFSNRFFWKALSLLALVAMLLLGWNVWQSHIRATKALETPFRADLKNRDGFTENDPSSVPSFQEAFEYILLCRKRPLTDGEVDRVLELAKDSNHTPTTVYSIGVLQSIHQPNRRDEIVGFMLKSLEHPDSKVRCSSMGALVTLGSKDIGPLLVPFLQSAQSSERDSAQMALTRLGFQFPKGNLD